jgi:predicted unusual protein kinase regulating ubiquinone biosynthesis (AarF/ABC1/UbiB family)
LVFPTYYPELSSDKIITMDWLEGMHLKDFLLTNPSQEVRNQIGQALWDFYHHQVHILRKVHADPHPGNFLFTQDGKVKIFDFGCVKEIPESFYNAYFALINPEIYKDEKNIRHIYEQLELIHPTDTEKELDFFMPLFKVMIDMLTEPFTKDEFDFGDEKYFGGVYSYVDYVSNLKEVRESVKARGSRHSLYINRTYYGLYHMLYDLRAVVNTKLVLQTAA